MPFGVATEIVTDARRELVETVSSGVLVVARSKGELVVVRAVWLGDPGVAENPSTSGVADSLRTEARRGFQVAIR